MEPSEAVYINTTEAAYEESSTTRAVKLTLYVLIFTVGLIGNSLVCLVVCRQRRLKTSTNYFILNLACADLAVILFCIPFDVAVQENGYVWPFGNILCRIIYPFMTLLSFASVGTLTAISLNRYRAISRPMRVNTAGKKRARLAIICIWVISAVLALPYVTALKLNKESQCEETWTTVHSRLYTVFIFVFQYFVPLSIITVAYVRIWIQLRRNRANMTAAHRAQDQDIFKVVRMMIIVVLIFAFCMLPNQILWLLKDFQQHTPMQEELLSWGAILVYANSCTNPVVYSICVEEFRVAFKSYIFKCHRVTEADLVGVGRLFERLSIRGGRHFSTSNSRSQIRIGRPDRRLPPEQLHLALTNGPKGSIQNGLVQGPKDNSPSPRAERSQKMGRGLKWYIRTRPKKESAVQITIV